MKILNIHLSEQDYQKYGIQSDNISFDHFIEKIKNVLAKEALAKCQIVAEKSGLGKMTMEEIKSEIDAVRNAKSNP